MGEQILVVKTSVINSLNYPEGAFLVDQTTINNTIKYLSEFVEIVDRDEAEGNIMYRQLIPYVILTCNDTYFSAVRTKAGGDSRLHHKRIVGFGGHMNYSEMPGKLNLKNQIEVNTQRELEEELIIRDSVSLKTCGFINDMSSPVSRDHFGIYIKGELTSSLVDINESSVLVDSGFKTKEELLSDPDLESWSRLVLYNL